MLNCRLIVGSITTPMSLPEGKITYVAPKGVWEIRLSSPLKIESQPFQATFQFLGPDNLLRSELVLENCTLEGEGDILLANHAEQWKVVPQKADKVLVSSFGMCLVGTMEPSEEQILFLRNKNLIREIR